ncbi:hypothetical protein C8J56DRAFT_478920 [Mycena floridula]|nr:hypothetical protein C8J56DRAFT_478920 [Mycena floridula]
MRSFISVLINVASTTTRKMILSSSPYHCGASPIKASKIHQQSSAGLTPSLNKLNSSSLYELHHTFTLDLQQNLHHGLNPYHLWRHLRRHGLESNFSTSPGTNIRTNIDVPGHLPSAILHRPRHYSQQGRTGLVSGSGCRTRAARLGRISRPCFSSYGRKNFAKGQAPGQSRRGCDHSCLCSCFDAASATTCRLKRRHCEL